MEETWNLPLKQRLRKRRSDDTEPPPTTTTVPSTSTADLVEPRESKEPKIASVDGGASKVCSLKTCGKIIDSCDKTLVEVKVAMNGKSSEFLSKSIVNWHSKSGEARFHGECWIELEKESRSRNRRISREEKALIKEALETAEWHDSVLEVGEKAVRIAHLLKQSSHAIAFTGAGISTSAGIGDYRGKDGKWTEMDRALAQGKEQTGEEQGDFKEEGEGEDDEGVAYEKLRPTYTHEALVKLTEMGFLKHVISQNGDGLHTLSGIPAKSLSELHGNVFLEICEKCGHRYLRPYYVMDDTASQYYEEMEEFGKASVEKPKYARKCHLCGLNHRTGRRCEQAECSGFLKDSIINFRDNLEECVLANAELHAKKSDLCLSLGTTMQVTPACELVEMGRKPLRVVIVNRQTTPLDHLALRKLSQFESTLGVRVYGDTDSLMQTVMKLLMSEEDLLTWEQGRKQRMKQYDHSRNGAK